MRPPVALYVALLNLAPLAGALGQGEFDRAHTPGRDARGEVAPLGSATPARTGPRFVPEDGLDPDLLPSPERPDTPDPDPEPEENEIELRLDGTLGTAFGHDTNVFRADRGRTDDGFSRSYGELELLTKFPDGNELFAQLSGESLLYFEQTEANENYLASFVEYFHPLTSWLELGLQNAFEYSRINLLDDNGDLFPRGRFGSLDEELRAFAIFRPGTGGEGSQLRNLAFEAGASFRDKNYDENDGVESLDYREGRFDASVSYKIARRPRSRLKLKYRFRLRNYREFRARDRDGTSSNQVLRLQRHQLNLTWFQQLDATGLDGKIVLGVGAVYNRDTHENDRSYREGSVTLRTELWPLPEWTRVDFALRGIARNFIDRRPSIGSGRLRHRLVELTVGAWQRLVQIPNREKASGTTVTVGFFARATASIWRSSDLREDYDRYVFEGGLEATW